MKGKQDGIGSIIYATGTKRKGEWKEGNKIRDID